MTGSIIGLWDAIHRIYEPTVFRDELAQNQIPKILDPSHNSSKHTSHVTKVLPKVSSSGTTQKPFNITKIIDSIKNVDTKTEHTIQNTTKSSNIIRSSSLPPKHNVKNVSTG